MFFFVILGRTDLRISLSEAKFDAEADFDVRSAVALPKPHQIDEKLLRRSKFIRFSFWHFFGLQASYRAETWTTGRS